jgi:hypothetical protein
MAEDHLSLLPPLARELVDVLGIEPTLALVRRFGGQTIYVPLEPKADHPVTLCLGEELARKLGKWTIRGDFIPVPKCEALLRAKRNAGIVTACTDKPINAIAQEHGLTRRQVFRIKAAAQDSLDESPQTDLFSLL